MIQVSDGQTRTSMPLRGRRGPVRQDGEWGRVQDTPDEGQDGFGVEEVRGYNPDSPTH
jgi:hypothetical protein